MYGYYSIAILSGIIGWVYSARLTDAGMILNWWYVFCDQKLPQFIAKPICTCYKCVSGQIGMWTYWLIIWSGSFDFQSLFLSIGATCISILVSLTLNKIINDGEAKTN